jgi:hypothetical protein
MAHFTVTAAVTISLTGRVEASSPEEARELAYELRMPQLCHFCVRREPQTWKLGEIDDEPTEVTVE